MTEPDPGNFHPVVMHGQIQRLEQSTKALKAEIEEIKIARALDEKAREDNEKRRLKWGISALGAAVMALSGAVWTLLPSEAQTAWQILRGENR
jgi:ferric-dicitrate binding protein FerR (iron transport regulator)